MPMSSQCLCLPNTVFVPRAKDKRSQGVQNRRCQHVEPTQRSFQTMCFIQKNIPLCWLARKICNDSAMLQSIACSYKIFPFLYNQVVSFSLLRFTMINKAVKMLPNDLSSRQDIAKISATTKKPKYKNR